MKAVAIDFLEFRQMMSYLSELLKRLLPESCNSFI